MPIERQNTMLEPVDREYLRGEKEYANPETEYWRERELTDRVYGALDDFQFLKRHIQGRTWEKLRTPEPTANSKARDDMAAAMAMFFEIHEANGWDFEETVRRAIEGAYSYGGARRDLSRTVVEEVGLQIKTHEPADPDVITERIQRKLKNDELLTDHEIAEAVKAGGIDTTRWLSDYLKEHRLEEVRNDRLERMLQAIQAENESESSD